MIELKSLQHQPVRNRSEPIGHIADILFDPESGRIVQILVDLETQLSNFKGSHLALSPDRFTQCPGEDQDGVIELSQEDIERFNTSLRESEQSDVPPTERPPLYHYQTIKPASTGYTVYPYSTGALPIGTAAIANETSTDQQDESGVGSVQSKTTTQCIEGTRLSGAEITVQAGAEPIPVSDLLLGDDLSVIEGFVSTEKKPREFAWSSVRILHLPTKTLPMDS